MISEKDYLKAKEIIQEYENQMNISNTKKSRYTEKLSKRNHIYTIVSWNDALNDGCICDDDGFGYWVKDGLKSFDDVFSTEQLDATHVVWYNK